MARSIPIRTWQAAAFIAAVAVAVAAAASVQRERYARAKKLGVSVVALTNPDRMLRRLRSAGL